MTAYYNEIDPKAAAWLRELIKRGLIADGVVDERSIRDVSAFELTEFTQCHFFAGIGGWSLALRMAGWPDDLPVYTGSCPCQPFSVAGLNKGINDDRHLWPSFARIIRIGKPTTVFGEQVASAAGRVWLSTVRADLEGMAYAVGGADLCAAGVGFPHVRQRLYWLAHAVQSRRESDKSGWLRLPRGVNPQQLVSRGSVKIHRGTLESIVTHILPSDGLSIGMERSRIHGYGNAIVPEIAAEFIASYMEII